MNSKGLKLKRTITTIEQLETIYGHPAETSTVKVTPKLTADYRRFIDASPFLTIATCGPEGLDCSPRGDLRGFVKVVDDQTLHIPDRRGNNRVDSLRNIVRDPRIALLFLIPGSGNTLRLNANAHISIDPNTLKSFEVKGMLPRSVIVASINEVYFQCARAIVRSEIWNPKRFVDENALPTAGEILANLSDGRIGGDEYDQRWPDRAKKSLW